MHLNEPGRTDWEGFWTGTRAAASGGITTVVDMPLNSIPPTTTVENLAAKRNAAREQCWTDVAFWGGVIPGNQVRNFVSFISVLLPTVFFCQDQLGPLVDAGVKGFKCFMIESGVEVSIFASFHSRSVVMDLSRNSHVSPKVICEPPCLRSR